MSVAALLRSSLSSSSAQCRGCRASLSLGEASLGIGSLTKLQLQSNDGFVEHFFLSSSPDVRPCMRPGHTGLRQYCLAAVQVTVLLAKLAGSNDLGFETGDREFS